MRKWIISVVVLFVAVLLVLPYGAGFVAQKKLTRLVDAIAQADNANVKAHLYNYHPGWFSSVANIDIEITPNINQMPKAKQVTPEKIKFTLHEKIFHGPLIVAKDDDGKTKVMWGLALIQTHLLLKPEHQATFDQLFADQAKKPKIEGHTLIKLTGGSSTVIEIPAFTFVEKQKNATIDWLGLQGVWDISSNMKKVDSKLKLNGVNVTSPEMKLELKRVKMKYKGEQNATGIWSGEGSFDFPYLSVIAGDQQKLLITGFEIDSKSDISSELLSATHKIDLEKIVIDGVSYGPGQYQGKLKNLDAVVLAKLHDQLSAANQAGQSKQQRQMMMMSLLPQIPDLFAKGAEYKIKKFFFTMPQGTLKADGGVEVQVSDDPTTAKFPAIMQRIVASLNMQAPVVLAEDVLSKTLAKQYEHQQALQLAAAKQAADSAKQDEADNKPQPQQLTAQQINDKAVQTAKQQLSAWVQQGFLQKEGDLYKVTVSYKQNQLLVNGKQLGAARN